MKFILIPRQQDATTAGACVLCWPILQGISPQVVDRKLLRAAQWLILAHMLKSVILLCFIQNHGKVLFLSSLWQRKWLLYLEFNQHFTVALVRSSFWNRRVTAEIRCGLWARNSVKYKLFARKSTATNYWKFLKTCRYPTHTNKWEIGSNRGFGKMQS